MTDRKTEILGKIQKLLELASNNPFGEEADSARKKADELMTVYTIESWELEQAKPKELREQVETKFVDICGASHPAKDGLRILISAVAQHCRCKILYWDYAGPQPFRAQMFGFPTDLGYAELLWTSLLMHVSKDMKPEFNPNESFDQNLVRFKESGMKWQEMHPLLQPGVPWERRHGVRYTGIYTRYCKETGRERMYTDPTVFVRSFVEGFAEKVNGRLWELQRMQREYEQQRGPGTGIMLFDRNKEVADAFAEATGNARALRLRPKKVDSTAQASGRRSAERSDLGQTRLGQKKELG